MDAHDRSHPWPGPARPIHDVLKSLAEARGLSFESLDPFSGCLYRVSNGKTSFLSGYMSVSTFPVNSSAASRVCRDKPFTYLTLRSAGLDVPPFQYFFLNEEYRRLREDGREFADCIAYLYAEDTVYPLVVKPADGSMGKFVTIAETRDEAVTAVRALSTRQLACVIQPLFQGSEYRLTFLDDEPCYLYRRLPPRLVGDGERTVRMLLDLANEEFRRAGRDPVSKTSFTLRKALAAHGLTVHSVVPKGIELSFSNSANTAAGGGAEFLEPADYPALVEWGRAIRKALTIRLCAIDFFAEDLADPATCRLLEVNSNPNFTSLFESGRAHILSGIWTRILDEWFGA